MAACAYARTMDNFTVEHGLTPHSFQLLWIAVQHQCTFSELADVLWWCRRYTAYAHTSQRNRRSLMYLIDRLLPVLVPILEAQTIIWQEGQKSVDGTDCRQNHPLLPFLQAAINHQIMFFSLETQLSDLCAPVLEL